MPDDAAAVAPEVAASPSIPVKRGPGRPRKNPLPIGPLPSQASHVPTKTASVISPEEFAARFYGNNPNLIQVLEAYPNKEVQAAFLFNAAYRGYLHAIKTVVPALRDEYAAVVGG